MLRKIPHLSCHSSMWINSFAPVSNTPERITHRAWRKLNYNRIQDHGKLCSRSLFYNDIKRIPPNLILTFGPKFFFSWIIFFPPTMTKGKLNHSSCLYLVSIRSTRRRTNVLLCTAISYVVVDYQHLTASWHVTYACALVKRNLRPAMIAEI